MLFRYGANPKSLSQLILEVLNKTVYSFCHCRKARKSMPLLRDIDRIVPLPLEIFNRHVARSKVFPHLAETYRALESGLLFFLCFVHLYHKQMIFSVQRYKTSTIIPNKNSKTWQEVIYNKISNKEELRYFFIGKSIIYFRKYTYKFSFITPKLSCAGIWPSQYFFVTL